MSSPSKFRPIVGIAIVLFIAGSATIYLGTLGSGAVDRAADDLDRSIKPAGKLLVDAATGEPAVAPLTMNFVRTPDGGGPDGQGRYLIAVNSGYGLTYSSKSRAQQTLSVIDLDIKPEPKVIQNVYFPAPQSANFGLAFDQKAAADGKYRLYVAGGYENKIWILGFDPKAEQPISPKNGPDQKVDSLSIDVAGFTANAPTEDYNNNVPPVYPTGIALSKDGNTLYSANNLSDNLGVVSELNRSRVLDRVDLHRSGSAQFLYPYDVKLLESGKSAKAYVSLWGDGTVAVVRRGTQPSVSHMTVGRHPTLMMFDRAKSRLFVANSDADTVSVIDTATDKVIETISVRLAEDAMNGVSPEGLALSPDEKTLYVANAHTDSVAVIRLTQNPTAKNRSKLAGFIPTGKYASAIAAVGDHLFIANGKGTGVENSSNKINDTGLNPNMPNRQYPGDSYNKRGQYSAAVVSGNISYASVPDDKRLYEYTQTTMRNNGLLGREKRSIFGGGKSPFKHVIYIIRENRTYDQIFGDLAASGNGQKADGDPSVAVFGAGETARSPLGTAQNVTPNARALALRFGLLDRFFVNSEASPDGHNWATAAFSNDYIDKAFRWNYSGRGRTYDYEGFNRLPSYEAPSGQPPVSLPSVFNLPATADDVANFQKKYVPYLNGGRDVGEPESLYLWDAAKRAGLSYRAYGEFISTVSAADLAEVNTRKSKKYPDLSPTLTAFAAKRSLEGHFAPQHRNFDQSTPDTFTTESYTAAKNSASPIDPAISDINPNEKFRGNSRYGTWSAEFRQFVKDLGAGKGDQMPNLSIVRFSNDHTSGLHKGTPTPQFYVAENDYAIGRLVDDVSKSPYWKDTAIFILEDDAQDGPDHVDAHRSPGFVISAYNRRGALVHEFHNTVSLIRTMELCLGIAPMNFLDANATPIDIFTATADLEPYNAVLPDLALDNLYPSDRPSARMAYYMRLTDQQDLSHQDMANPRELNEIIWFSVRGDAEMPGIASLPAYELMTAGIRPDDEEKGEGDED